MEDLSAAVLVCLNPNVDKNLTEQALQYCQRVRQSPDGWAFILQNLSVALRPEVAFWCCQVLHDVLRNPTQYPGHFSREQRASFRAQFLAYMAQLVQSGEPGRVAGVPITQQPRFLLNKVSQVIAALIAADYPHEWTDAFRRTIMPLVSSEQGPSQASTGMFFRLLRALDEDVTSIRASQLSEHHRVTSVRVKDAMRDDCVPSIMQRCGQLISQPIYISAAFDIVARYVEWIDIGLVLKDAIVAPMYAAIRAQRECVARGSAAYALRSIILKRMSPDMKINLLRTLQIEALLESIPVDLIRTNPEQESDPDLTIQSSQVEVASLVNTLCMTVLDILKEALKEKNANLFDSSVHEFSTRIAQEAIGQALRLTDENTEEGSSSQTLQCVTAYVNVFIRIGKSSIVSLNADGISAISAILEVVEKRALMPSNFDPHDDGSDGNSSFAEQREVLIKNVFRSIVRAAPELCAEFVRKLFSRAAENADISLTELSLRTLIVLTSTAPDVPLVAELRRKVISNPPACMLFSSDIPISAMDKQQRARHNQLELIAITYFDLVARSYRLFLTRTDTQLLSSVLPVFFDGRGLSHRSSESIRSQAAYSLLKLARPLRTVVTTTHLDAVLNAAHVHLFPLKLDTVSQEFKNQMLIFETVGYLLGTDHKRQDTLQYLTAILNPLMKAVQEHTGPACAPSICASGALSKGFGGDSKPLLLIVEDPDPKRTELVKLASAGDEAPIKDVKVQRVSPLTPEMQKVWTTCLEAIIKASAVCLAPTGDASLIDLRMKLVFFLHRMIDTIGSNVLPYLEQILPELLNGCESPLDLRDAIILASQALTKFGKHFESVAMRIYLSIVRKVHRHSFSIDPNTLMAISEDGREAVEMHRAYTYFLHAIVGTSLIHILLHEANQSVIKTVMDSLLASAIGEHLDVRVGASVMKMSLHMLCQMVEKWTGSAMQGNGSATPTGFIEFAVQRISTASVLAGIRGTIFRYSDYDSGQSVAVVTEIVTLQRVCGSHLNRAFAEFMLKEPLKSVPLEVSEKYLAAVYAPGTPTSVLVQGYTTIAKMMRSM
ncbi:Exportin-T [Gracilaria domingensis]|nr:Exportin-T [Gracilaria domingensis]